MLAAYPDLARRTLAIHLKPHAGGVWLVTVDEVVAPAGPPPDVATPAPTAVLLRARIAFDRANRLLSFDANGPYLFDRQNADLREAAVANLGWIESDADVHLMRMGAEPTVGRVFTSEAPPDGPVALSTKDADFVRLVERHGTPPQVILVTCGNTSNDQLRLPLEKAWPLVVPMIGAERR